MLRHTAPGERRDEISERERAPRGEEAEEVSHETDKFVGADLATDVFHREGVVALTEAVAIGCEEEREVRIGGRIVAEGTEEETLFVGSREEVSTTDDTGDTHKSIVDDDGEVVGIVAIGTAEDDVATVGGKIGGLRAVEDVGERVDDIGEVETPSRLAGGTEGDTLSVGEAEASEGVDSMAIGRVRSGGGMEVGTGAEALVEKSGGGEA